MSKPERLCSGDTFEHEGYRFKFDVEHDADIGPPWKEFDNYGIVSEWTCRDKDPGERVLAKDHSGYRFLYYDFEETMKLAAKDGWGLAPEDQKRLAEKLGRQPSNAEILAEAVEQDYQ